MDPFQGDRMQGEIADLPSLAVHAQMFDASALQNVLDGQSCCLFAAQPVIQQHGQNRPIALAFQGVRIGSVQQRLRLVIGECQRLAFGGFNLGPFDPMHRVTAGDRIAVEQVIEQAGQRRELAPDRCPGQAALFELVTPGQDVRPGDSTELLGGREAQKAGEVLDVALVGTARARVIQGGLQNSGKIVR